MLRLSAALSIISLLTSLLSFFNQILIARLFGVGVHLDDYLVAVSLPLLITGSVANLFSFEVIPILVRRSVVDGKDFSRFCAAIFLMICLAGIALPAILYPLVPTLTRIMAPNLVGSRFAEVVLISRIMWTATGLSLIVSFLVALQNAERSFILAAITTSFPYVGMIASMLMLSRSIGTAALALGILAGTIASIPFLLRGISIRIATKLNHQMPWGEAIAPFRNVPVVFIAALCLTSYAAIDAFWAARLNGGLSFLGYGQRIVIVIAGILSAGSSTVITPYLAETHARGENETFDTMVARAIKMALAVSIPSAAIITLLRLPILEVLFQRGAFDSAAAHGVALVLPGQLLGMVAMICVILMMKTLHARRRAVIASLMGMTGVGLHFVVAGFLSRKWGLIGISTSYALSWWTLFALFSWQNSPLRRGRPAAIIDWKFALALGTTTIASCIGTALAANYLIRPIAAVGFLALAFRLAAVMTVSGCVFFIFGLGLFPLDEYKTLLGLLPRRFLPKRMIGATMMSPSHTRGHS